ncbi:MAG: carbamoyltransferase HypF [bacterium]
MANPIRRFHLDIRGAVQGVGFRPFLYRMAADLRLAGWVSNTPQGVIVEVEGPAAAVDRFVQRVQDEKPPHSTIQHFSANEIPAQGSAVFEIRASLDGGVKSALMLPDLGTCRECRDEVFDPRNRRYLYPFTNCTHCGPRFSIIESLPYDRPHTSMKHFAMCPRCREEYENPLDRRFHAQPNACPECGPRVEWWDATGHILSSSHEAMLDAAAAIREGRIVAVKGLGGFHLMADARDPAAVARLRERKHREEKPFALLFPSLESLREECEVSDLEENLLLSPESPIVLLRRKIQSASTYPVCRDVAPGNPYLGAMLPYTPLHHILLRELGFPVIATSGNLSDEPICTDEHEALQRLAGIADGFLVHNRPIVRHVDDSIVRVIAGREMILRRARGYAPLPIESPDPVQPTLAVGAHLKNAIALGAGTHLFISQHIGDLETPQAYGAFLEVIGSFQRVYETTPAAVVCDLHPDYLSTHYAGQTGLPVKRVQHHYAHVLSCMAEHHLNGPVLGVSWDGTGYGLDGTIWGGEFLLATREDFTRLAHWRTFPLPSGEKAVKEPRRIALGLLYECLGNEAFQRADSPPLQSFTPNELGVLRNLLEKSLLSPRTSSVGRLFDAVAALMGLRFKVSFEGQAAMELEFALAGVNTGEAYPVEMRENPAHSHDTLTVPRPWVVDWDPMLRAILSDIRVQTPAGLISARFHNALVESIVDIARRAGERIVVLTGGCFQNRYLAERAIARLREEGFEPYWHRRVPPNDGGIALGQIWAAREVKG